MAEVQGNLINLEVDLAGGTTFTKIVCQTGGTISGSRPVNRTQTNCGSKVSIGSPEYTITTDFVLESAPTGTDISYPELLAAFLAGTLIKAQVEYDATGSIFHHQGDGYITNLELNWATEEACNCSITIDITGTMDVTPA